MSKHTPGPWFPTKVSDYNEVARIGRAWNISTMLALADFGDVDADARLIAAAPDLLDALKEERRIRLIGQSPECGQSHWESMRDLRRAAYEATDAAIAKATGEKA